MARNLLASKLEQPPNDWRASLPRYSKENLEKNQSIIDKISDLSKKYNCTPAQLSLGWIFHKAKELGVTVVPIPGSTKITNATSNAGSVKITISDADTELLESLADQVAGARGDEWYMSLSIENQQ